MVSRRGLLVGGVAAAVTVAASVAAWTGSRVPEPPDIESDDRCPFCGEREQLGRVAYKLYGGRPPGPWGGCSIMPDSPKWHCFSCGRRWGRDRPGR